ncbi:von Willebrand factor type A domain-containing protein [Pelagibacterium halotolerans]|uniref:vWA domain-containing protein n=1 Tax=Pelagibacterium halotolerans TaxID=531813 RepID=UPI00384F30C2
MADDRLKSLRNATVPPPSKRARKSARDAAMAAFDAVQNDATVEKKSATVQGSSFGARLRSITSKWKGPWTMELRYGLGAAFVAVLFVPLGWQLLNQTALTPPTVPQFELGSAETEPAAVAEPAPAAPQDLAGAPKADAEAREQIMASEELATESVSPVPTTSASQSMQTMSGIVTSLDGGFAEIPSTGDRFTAFEENGVTLTAQEPVSTFSADVDTASYAYVRRALEMGQVPPADAIRVEELINYFTYDYPAPEFGGAPFQPTIAVTPSPWDADNRLVHIGIRGEAIDVSAVPPANLVLLIDMSGSMDAPDKLPLLKRSLGLLVNEMGPEDRISIVTYAGDAGVVLEPTSGDDKAAIIAAIDGLEPGGSTAGAAGIEEAYRLAESAFIENGTNRVLLATDGDFNVGLSDPNGLEDFIAGKRDDGIFLSVLGFGMGNYNDAVMQALAQAGNGTAAYIDDFAEARKVLVEEMGATLVTIAKDVKIQVEFNPATVSEYRLIGYETRALAREDFNNDRVDAGDVGAGHTVTAIYEITPLGAPGSVDPLRYGETEPVPEDASGELGYLKIRYKAPDSNVSALIEAPITQDLAIANFDEATPDIAFATAVAAFGQKLKGSDAVYAMSWDEIRALAEEGRGEDPTGRRAEFIGLIGLAESLTQ